MTDSFAPILFLFYSERARTAPDITALRQNHSGFLTSFSGDNKSEAADSDGCVTEESEGDFVDVAEMTNWTEKEKVGAEVTIETLILGKNLTVFDRNEDEARHVISFEAELNDLRLFQERITCLGLSLV